MTLELPPLPFAIDALEPYMSARTLEFHHGKHHKSYIDNTNAAIAGTPLENRGLPEIIRSARASGDQTLFNNAAQAWNHDFFWKSLSPDGGGAPSGELKSKIESAFGGFDGFANQFRDVAEAHFGSGWAWLCRDAEGLAIVSTHDSETPIADGRLKPLLTLDLWEHAYYLDYQNSRSGFIDAFLGNTISWAFAAANYD